MGEGREPSRAGAGAGPELCGPTHSGVPEAGGPGEGGAGQEGGGGRAGSGAGGPAASPGTPVQPERESRGRTDSAAAGGARGTSSEEVLLRG